LKLRKIVWICQRANWAKKMSFSFDVLGQKGAIPSVGFGTATLFGEEVSKAVRTAIKAGCRLIDTALLYNNQEAVGEGIRAAIEAGEVTRADLWVVSCQPTLLLRRGRLPRGGRVARRRHCGHAQWRRERNDAAGWP